MNITYLIPPGKFPTVVRDPGVWYNVAIHDGNNVNYYNANKEFWKIIFSHDIENIINSSKVDEYLINEVEKASINIANLKKADYIKTKTDFIKIVAALTNYIDLLNNLQNEIIFSLITTIHVKNLDYGYSRCLVDYAGEKNFLSQLVEKSLVFINQPIDLLLIQVTSREDLLTALVAISLLRKTNKNMHVCLADHGYENFSLHSLKDNFEKSNTLINIFDTIISYKEEKDEVINCLINYIKSGKQIKGFIDMNSFNDENVNCKDKYILPLIDLFTEEYILSTRFSDGGCYWSKCTFCTQNAKYKITNHSNYDYIEVINKVENFINSGYTIIFFSDEAIPPTEIEKFSREVIKRGIKFKWSCRCRLEKAFSKDLLKLMKEAGCYEVLFGLESISEKVLNLMNKYPENIDVNSIGTIIKNVISQGLKIHLTLIAGFPGEEVSDFEETAQFLINALKGSENNAFWINKFVLFPETTVFHKPDEFNITLLNDSHDLYYDYKFKYNNGPYKEIEALNNLIYKWSEILYNEIGWAEYGDNKEVRMAMFLYYFSGLGASMKSKE